MILTLDDKPIFFPSIDLEESTLLGYLVRAQAIAESSQGANRPLELQQHIANLEIPASLFFLDNTPISLDSLPIIEQKISQNPYPHTFGYDAPIFYHRSLYNRLSPLAYRVVIPAYPQDISPIDQAFGLNWRLIDPVQYWIEPKSGRVELRYWAIASSLRITYYGGYDFSINTPDVLAIKSAVAAILKYLLFSDGLINSVQGGNTSTPDNLSGGLPVEIDVVDDIKVKYANVIDSAAGTGLINKGFENALMFLSSFRKRRVYGH